jgi:2',3'-cyclic-nucleotide 2'-phosphodiesterase (5'-nucleotidase family)
MLQQKVTEIKQKMRAPFASARISRLLLHIFFLALVAPVGYGQGTAIEPCPASPGVVNTALSNPARVSTRTGETLVDSSIPDDATVEKLLAPYTERVRGLNVVLGRLEGELKKSSIGSGTLGNFVTDAIRSQARVKLGRPVVLAITNSGGLRKNQITPGELRASDIFELLPFENALVAIDLPGAQVLKLLALSVRDSQAGAVVRFRWNEQSRPELISAKLIDDNGHQQEIDTHAIYTIVTVDYLLNLRSGNYSTLQEGKNVKPLDLTLRDAVIAYIKAETAAGRSISARLDDRFVQVGPGPAVTERPHDE